tara:strand:- start:766 stop:1356 length:591 start_codon:yes stop_codon:yes gene_type:complete
MKFEKKVAEYINISANTILSLKDHIKSIEKISKLINKAYKQKRTLYVCGNGGSDSEAEHFVTELVCTFENRKRKPLSAISLNSNSSSISAWSNDFDYKTFLKRSVEAHLKKNDILFILTTSGGSKKLNQSKNIISAAKVAKKIGAKIISLTGKKGGEIINLSDLSIHIKNNKTSHIQEAHLAILHLICIFFEKKYL